MITDFPDDENQSPATSLDRELPYRMPLETPGGAASVIGIIKTDVTVAKTDQHPYLAGLEAVCIDATGAGSGVWALDLGFIPYVPVLKLQQPVSSPVVGTKVSWDFPVTWKGETSKAITVKPSADLGIWVFTATGFYSSI